jgi:branched-chain amino acid transport system ATP-binding protein
MMLSISSLDAWYGRSHAIQGVGLEVGRGEVVALMGRNGAGKSTTLRSIMGLVDRASGSVRFDGEELLGLPVHARFHRGLAYVPEERRIVPGLSVRDSILLGGAGLVRRPRDDALIERASQLFPVLGKRLDQHAASLSGGEQQMLAIAIALVSEPRMLLLDEPSEGIMPILAEEMFARLAAMKAAGTTILLVDQHVSAVLAIADRVYVMDAGRVVLSTTAAEARADRSILDTYLAI